MLLQKMITKHLYRPFSNTSLYFFSKTSLSNHSLQGNLINDIDLYYQPLVKPTTALAVLISKLIITLIGEFIGVKLLSNLKKDNSILNHVTTFLVLTQMVGHPIYLVFTTANDFLYPANEVIGKWFCTLGWMIIMYFSYVSLFYSCIVALMRHFFILNAEKAQAYGKEKAKRNFLIMAVVVPLLCVVWESTESLHITSYINKCYGYDQRVFLIETSTLNVFKNKFWELDSFTYYGVVELSIVIAKRVSKILKAIVLIVFGANIFEGFLYYKILTHMYR